MYSSGTTGAPKCIVHGHGGTLINHLKEHRLHSNMRDGDILFYFTGKFFHDRIESVENKSIELFLAVSWMMWNWVSDANQFHSFFCERYPSTELLFVSIVYFSSAHEI